LRRRAEGILLGDPSMPETEMGPVCFPQHLERIGGFVERARKEGATVITGGARPTGRSELGNGLFYAPTIVTGVAPEMEIAQEEIFGPVLAVMEFESDDEAVELANNSRYGLACGVWTGSIDRAMKMSERLEAGIVWINTYRAASYAAPWGGWKESGYGRESSPEAINELTQVKSVWIDSSGNIADPFTVR
jgi:(Z)-2-((N-methylformamido)methylene)-5-hydroxybutyrolactone dehydrogenase